MSSPTGGEWVVRMLAREGVRHVFGIPGIHNLAIYDALLRQSEIVHILARHEQGAAFMADGYARASGAPRTLIVPARPAATTPRRPPCHVADVDAAARRLRAATRPLIITGGGVIAAGAERELAAVARRLDAPVISTVAGRGALDERDRLWHSVLPDRRATAGALQAADVVLAVGTKLGHRSLEKLGVGLGPGQTLVHLDLDPAVIDRAFKAEIAVVGDARDGLARLLQALGDGAPATGWDRARLAALRQDAGPRFTPDVAAAIATLRGALPEDAIVVNDQTGLTYWMEHRFPVYAPRTFLYPTGSAVLGYAVPAAIGAKLARPERAVIAIAGDGGFMFSGAELATAGKYRSAIGFLVVNDAPVGARTSLQQRMYEGRWGEADLTNPDFPALARAFGARGERLAGIDALPDAIGRALAGDGPTLLELRMTIEPPWE